VASNVCYNNVITDEDHLARFYNAVGEVDVPQDHEDVVMKLFSLSLEEDVKVWYRAITDRSIRSWQDFHDAFMKGWSISKDFRMLLTQLREIKKKENETVKEFDDRFMKLVDNVPEKIRTLDDALLFTFHQHL